MTSLDERGDREAELHREINALCGLVHFARERCYPPALIDQLEAQFEARLAQRAHRVEHAAA